MPSAAASAHHNLRGILIRCAGVACFALMSAAFKWASDDGVGPIEMLFFRGLVGVPLVLAWLAAGKGVGAVRTARPGAHLFRAVLGVGALFLVYQALVRLPLADATTIGFSAPAFSTILSALILGETIGRHRWTAVVLGFVGVVIVMQPGGGVLPVGGVAYALAAALGTGAATVTIRQMGSREDPAAIAFWFLVFALVVGAIGMFWVAEPHRPLTWLLLVLGGVAGAATQMLISRSLHLAPVSVVVPFDYGQIVWAALLGWLIWSTPPGLNTLAGATLIAISGLYTVRRERRLRKDSIAATTAQ